MARVERYDSVKQNSLESLPSIPNQHGSSGQRIGPYVLGKTLGVGTTGRVKLAVHLESGQKVAIKIISKEHCSSNEEKKQQTIKMEREITIMKLIQQYFYIDILVPM